MRLSVPTGKRLIVPADPFIPPINYAVSYAFSLRIVVVGYTDSLIRLRRDSDDAELDFSAVPETGVLDVGASTAWLAGANGFVTTWYDQSGNNRDIVQATDALQPKYVDWHNGNPAILWDASDDFLSRAGLDLAQPLEVSWVWQSASQGVVFFFDASEAADRCIGFIDTGGLLAMNAGSTITTPGDLTDADTHYGSIQFAGAASVLRHDGADKVSGNPGTANQDGIVVGARFSGTSNYDGHFYEYISSSGGLLSTAQRNALEADQADFYGVP